MTREIVSYVPWDRVSDLSDPLLEGIVTDRDLCCGNVTDGKNADAIKISQLVTPLPVMCQPHSTVDGFEELMQENKVRRIGVVGKRGRCIGMVSRADVALRAPAGEAAKTMSGLSRSAKPSQNLQFDKDLFYCGQLHGHDEIWLLNRRHEPRQKLEAVQ